MKWWIILSSYLWVCGKVKPVWRFERTVIIVKRLLQHPSGHSINQLMQFEICVDLYSKSWHYHSDAVSHYTDSLESWELIYEQMHTCFFNIVKPFYSVYMLCYKSIIRGWFGPLFPSLLDNLCWHCLSHPVLLWSLCLVHAPLSLKGHVTSFRMEETAGSLVTVLVFSHVDVDALSVFPVWSDNLSRGLDRKCLLNKLHWVLNFLSTLLILTLEPEQNFSPLFQYNQSHFGSAFPNLAI